MQFAEAGHNPAIYDSVSIKGQKEQLNKARIATRINNLGAGIRPSVGDRMRGARAMALCIERGAKFEDLLREITVDSLAGHA